MAMPARNWLWLLLCVLPVTHGVNKMCNVCIATACVQRGARLFENAMLELKTDDVSVNQAGCIRKCGKGVVFKAFGGQLEESAPSGLIGWYPVVDDEQVMALFEGAQCTEELAELSARGVHQARSADPPGEHLHPGRPLEEGLLRLDLAVEDNVIKKAGAWFSYGDVRLGQGRENAKQFLREHQDLFAEIRGKVVHNRMPSPSPKADAETEKAD